MATDDAPIEPRLTIGVDVRAAAGRERRGVGEYTVQVLSAMMGQAGRHHDWRYVCLGAEPAELPPSVLAGDVKFCHRRVRKLVVHHLAAMATHRWDDNQLGKLDVFFIPTAHMLALDPRTPVVVTVHDAFFSTTHHLMSRREQLWHKVVAPERLYRRADRLIADSEATRRRILTVLPEVAERVEVIPPGIRTAYHAPPSGLVIDEMRARLDLPSRYVLFLGALEPRKNVARLLEAFAIARHDGFDHDLVLAGPITADSQAILRNARLDGVRILGYVRDEDKPALYAAASALAMPSRDEGFGFPPLEALAIGTPSLVSDIDIFVETLGDSAVRVPPDDVEGMARALSVLCHDEAVRSRILAGRPGVIARFDWARCANATLRQLLLVGGNPSR